MKTDLDKFLSDDNFDALWVSGPLQHNPDMVYLTGIQHVTQAELIKKTGEPPILFLFSPMEREEAEKTGLQIRSLSDAYPLQKYLAKNNHVLKSALAARMGDVFKELGLSDARIAVFGSIPMNQSKAIHDELEKFLPKANFVGIIKDNPINFARKTKDRKEFEQIKKMGSITIQVVEKVKDFLTTRRVENQTLISEKGSPLKIGDVKQKINLWLAEAGAENPEGTIFAIGRDGGIPHSAGNLDDVIELGKPIVFDIFPCEAGSGYFYDFTRTWCLDFAPADVVTIHKQVLDVHHQVTNQLREGKPFRFYQELTCELFSSLGHPTIADSNNLEEGYVHSVGHGLGLEVHETPFSGITSTDKDILEQGVVFSIEPGLYYPSKGFGVRIEDTIYLNPDGKFEIVVDFPYDLVLPMRKK